MRCVDVNVLVYAHREDLPEHEPYRDWLEDSRGGDEPLGLSDLVLSGFVRVVTHPRIFREPTPLDIAIAFAQTLRDSPNALSLAPGSRHWKIFARLCRDADARGNLVPDAYLAALVIETGGTWYSADRGLARFADLDWRHPLDA